MSIELKIKSKHLSEEARIIRFEERKLKKQYRYKLSRGENLKYVDIPEWNKFWNIQTHRKTVVRNENRATFLARALLEGRRYDSVERSVHNVSKLYHEIAPRVISMVQKYGNVSTQEANQLVRDWLDGKDITIPTKE